MLGNMQEDVRKTELWGQYEQEKSEEIRNELAEQYLGFIRYIARQVESQFPLPDGIDQEDLVQYGSFGLMKAIEDYNRDKGGRFESYAAYRIRGAMQDHIRRHRKENGGITRTIVNKTKEMDKVVKKLERELKRTPFPQEIADELGIEVEEYYKKVNALHRRSAMSLDKQIGSDEGLTVIEVIQNEQTPTPEDAYIENEQREILRQAIEGLPENERMVIEMRYFQKYTLKKIGKLLKRSEPRISQLHKQALKRLEAQNIL